MRALPTDPNGNPLQPPEVGINSVPPNSLIRQVRHYCLITPLFGGGVQPQEADPVSIVRAASIRGHLRFWWRATRGGLANGEIETMRKMEADLWGGTSQPSKVTIRVLKVKPGNSVDVFDHRNRYNNQFKRVAYALFPLQGEREDRRSASNRPPGKLHRSVSFELEVTFPQAEQEAVEAAFWAWQTFGGIGARTRRGLGAVQLLAIDDIAVRPLAPEQVEGHIRESLRRYVVSGKWPEGVPYLSPTMRLVVKTIHHTGGPRQRGGTGEAPWVDEFVTESAWANLVEALQKFRQHRLDDARGRRNPAPREGVEASRRHRPSVSSWPEANAIRMRACLLQNIRERSPQGIDKFPRASIGLPIIFHFKDPGEPADSTLRLSLEGRTRFASPVIVRPIACAHGQAVGLAALLKGTRLPEQALEWVRENRGPQRVKASLAPDEVEKIKPLRGESDVLQALMDHIESPFENE